MIRHVDSIPGTFICNIGCIQNTIVVHIENRGRGIKRPPFEQVFVEQDIDTGCFVDPSVALCCVYRIGTVICHEQIGDLAGSVGQGERSDYHIFVAVLQLYAIGELRLQVWVPYGIVVLEIVKDKGIERLIIGTVYAPAKVQFELVVVVFFVRNVGSWKQ